MIDRTAIERAQLYMAWLAGADVESQHPIAAVGRAFTLAIRAANAARYPVSHYERVCADYIEGRITARSLEIELTHLPGGIPPCT